ncbi:IQ calmodulin-binding protein motif family protein [Strigomonas culicis]|uniref:IQ calmodulin-binding protein motif family protein n=1 Tax=Strigomonas culicis TaxID=28005 RepID=S9TYQ1_9TRYP|nr:IQ calmodulin-binding protein motif family protein [Strigomonas culicis]|eukprot:EPY21788.1 IQ calmodulin-binding protein motif family protein [Strigomonas culicis]
MRPNNKPSWTGSRAPPPKGGRLLPLLTPNPRTSTKIEEPLHSNNPNDGLILMIERGEVPRDYDLEPALTTAGPMRSTKAPLYQTRDKTKLRVMTETTAFSRVKDVKLDFSEIEKLPAKLNMSELKQWEVDEEKSRREAAVAAAAAAASHALTVHQDVSNSKAAMEPLGERDDARTYTELLDLYSMHEFIIRKGKTLRNTPEFASFKRHYQASWGNIESLLQILEDFLRTYGVDMAYVDGKRLAGLATFYSGGLLNQQDLADCIANYDDVAPLIGDIGQQYQFGTKGHHMAATKIQSSWRMYKQRVAYVHLIIGTRAATIIQRQWATHRAHCTTRRTIAAVLETRQTKWRQTMDEFISRWPRIREGRRTIIHIPSLSFPSFHTKRIPFYFAQQLGQLTRMADLADPLVNLIIIAPFKPEPEILTYYFSILEDAGVTNVAGRFTLLTPEDSKRLPEGLSLTRMMLLSSRLMKLLAAASTGKPAYIVPGVVGPEELLLASQLNLPLLSSEPKVTLAFGAKSGCKRLLEAADVATPPGVARIKSLEEMLHSLATLILEHRDIARWLVKLETEGGSRGHAYFDVSGIKALRKTEGMDRKVIYENVVRELREEGAKRSRIVHITSYSNWSAYVHMLDQVGAIIEAVPPKLVTNVTANLFIEPTGEVMLRSVVEPTLGPAFTVLGSVFPPTSSIPYDAVRDAAMSVGRAAFRKRIIGYLSVDFAVFDSSVNDEKTQKLWGVDIDLFFTNNAAAHELALLITHSGWDPQRGIALYKDGEEAMRYFYSGLVYNPFLSLVRHGAFFSLCQSRRVSFDRDRRRGVVFHLVDVMLRGCIGVLSIDSDMSALVKT